MQYVIALLLVCLCVMIQRGIENKEERKRGIIAGVILILIIAIVIGLILASGWK